MFTCTFMISIESDQIRFAFALIEQQFPVATWNHQDLQPNSTNLNNHQFVDRLFGEWIISWACLSFNNDNHYQLYIIMHNKR